MAILNDEQTAAIASEKVDYRLGDLLDTIAAKDAEIARLREIDRIKDAHAQAELARLKAEPSATDLERARALVKRINAALEGGERFRVGKWVARWADLDTREQTIAGLIATEFAAIRASQPSATEQSFERPWLDFEEIECSCNVPEYICFFHEHIAESIAGAEKLGKRGLLGRLVALRQVAYREGFEDASQQVAAADQIIEECASLCEHGPCAELDVNTRCHNADAAAIRALKGKYSLAHVSGEQR